MNEKHTARAALLASAFIGGVICVLADLVQKSEASAILLIGQKLGNIVGVPSPTLVAIAIILIIATSLPAIFDSASKKAAFYAGASVLAILMTVTPYNAPPGLKTEPNSVEVNLTIQTEDGGKVDGAIVTATPLNGSGNTARSRVQGSQIRFYLDGGKYRVIVEMPGYVTASHTLSLVEGSEAQAISIKLKPTTTPLFIQRIFR